MATVPLNGVQAYDSQSMNSRTSMKYQNRAKKCATRFLRRYEKSKVVAVLLPDEDDELLEFLDSCFNKTFFETLSLYGWCIAGMILEGGRDTGSCMYVLEKDFAPRIFTRDVFEHLSVDWGRSGQAMCCIFDTNEILYPQNWNDAQLMFDFARACQWSAIIRGRQIGQYPSISQQFRSQRSAANSLTPLIRKKTFSKQARHICEDNDYCNGNRSTFSSRSASPDKNWNNGDEIWEGPSSSTSAKGWRSARGGHQKRGARSFSASFSQHLTGKNYLDPTSPAAISDCVWKSCGGEPRFFGVDLFQNANSLNYPIFPLKAADLSLYIDAMPLKEEPSKSIPGDLIASSPTPDLQSAIDTPLLNGVSPLRLRFQRLSFVSRTDNSDTMESHKELPNCKNGIRADCSSADGPSHTDGGVGCSSTEFRTSQIDSKTTAERPTDNVEHELLGTEESRLGIRCNSALECEIEIENNTSDLFQGAARGSTLSKESSESSYTFLNSWYLDCIDILTMHSCLKAFLRWLCGETDLHLTLFITGVVVISVLILCLLRNIILQGLNSCHKPAMLRGGQEPAPKAGEDEAGLAKRDTESHGSNHLSSCSPYTDVDNLSGLRTSQTSCRNSNDRDGAPDIADSSIFPPNPFLMPPKQRTFEKSQLNGAFIEQYATSEQHETKMSPKKGNRLNPARRRAKRRKNSAWMHQIA